MRQNEANDFRQGGLRRMPHIFVFYFLFIATRVFFKISYRALFLTH